jgi:ribosomal protein S18 acetylase RimI-like enzyme/catechol 2,3-dioxygenase-like lactoylglutathione lyase family enzyme
MKVLVRALGAADAAPFQSLRLQGLRDDASAFAASYEEEVGTPLEQVARQLQAAPDGVVLGAFDGETLLGVVGVQRERARKLAHKAVLWGMYVAPAARRAGVGRRLVRQALEHARNVLGVSQVNLGVNTRNTAALALYRGLGFEIYGTERGYIRVDGVAHDDYQMVCVLAREDRSASAIPFATQRIDHVVLRVADLERSIAFYGAVLGCVEERHRADLGLVHLRAGASMIDLVDINGRLGLPGGPAAGAQARNVDHLCLRVDPFVEDEIVRHLAAQGVQARGPATLNFGAEGTGPSLYIQDPDGNVVELKGPSHAPEPRAV